ncbi:hypothetical protein CEXT_793031 [Caerostris extrusa]|uniref:Uncharacterized protein n=1 Tax=Caerostris extrusa TaxID=172846 RepID=A0AAV4VFC7_CAEEX|nr:hypothetical protein CEXT_793031 [Caerostris extrusa]
MPLLQNLDQTFTTIQTIFFMPTTVMNRHLAGEKIHALLQHYPQSIYQGCPCYVEGQRRRGASLAEGGCLWTSTIRWKEEGQRDNNSVFWKGQGSFSFALVMILAVE